MADIKTRDAVKGTIKTIDKAAVVSERMKAAEKKQAQAAEERNGSQPHHGTASRSPAPDAPANAGANGKSQLIKTRQQGQKTIKTTARNTEKTVKSAAKGTVKTAEKAAQRAAQAAKATAKATAHAVKVIN